MELRRSRGSRWRRRGERISEVRVRRCRGSAGRRESRRRGCGDQVVLRRLWMICRPLVELLQTKSARNPMDSCQMVGRLSRKCWTAVGRLIRHQPLHLQTRLHLRPVDRNDLQVNPHSNHPQARNQVAHGTACDKTPCRVPTNLNHHLPLHRDRRTATPHNLAPLAAKALVSLQAKRTSSLPSQKRKRSSMPESSVSGKEKTSKRAVEEVNGGNQESESCADGRGWISATICIIYAYVSTQQKRVRKPRRKATRHDQSREVEVST